MLLHASSTMQKDFELLRSCVGNRIFVRRADGKCQLIEKKSEFLINSEEYVHHAILFSDIEIKSCPIPNAKFMVDFTNRSNGQKEFFDIIDKILPILDESNHIACYLNDQGALDCLFKDRPVKGYSLLPNTDAQEYVDDEGRLRVSLIKSMENSLLCFENCPAISPLCESNEIAINEVCENVNDHFLKDKMSYTYPTFVKSNKLFTSTDLIEIMKYEAIRAPIIKGKKGFVMLRPILISTRFRDCVSPYIISNGECFHFSWNELSIINLANRQICIDDLENNIGRCLKNRDTGAKSVLVNMKVKHVEAYDVVLDSTFHNKPVITQEHTNYFTLVSKEVAMCGVSKIYVNGMCAELSMQKVKKIFVTKADGELLVRFYMSDCKCKIYYILHIFNHKTNEVVIDGVSYRVPDNNVEHYRLIGNTLVPDRKTLDRNLSILCLIDNF